MANGKIRVRLRAFDVALIDQSAKDIVQHIITEIATVLESFVNIFASLAQIVVLSLLRF